MRQKLFKAIIIVALVVSVFFCTSLTVLAADADVASGDIIVDGVNQEYNVAELLAEVDDYEYQGASSLHTQTAFGKVQFSTNVGNAIDQYNALSYFKIYIPVLTRFSVERGHTYSGQIYFYLTMPFDSLDDPSSPFDWNYQGISLSGFEQTSLYDGVTVSFYGFSGFAGGDSTEFNVTVCVTFDNFQPSFTDYLNINSGFSIEGIIQCASSIPVTKTGIPTLIDVYPSVSTDWYGTLKDFPTDAVNDSTGTLITNQTIQQQQIANQQSQQSEQQHNSLINGYDNAANDTMLADKNSVLQGFEQQQDQAISDGQQYVADFSANYDTAPLVAMAPAFMMISTWFNDLWGGMGNFSTVLIVGLMLCVAGYILKLKH